LILCSIFFDLIIIECLPPEAGLNYITIMTVTGEMGHRIKNILKTKLELFAREVSNEAE